MNVVDVGSEPKAAERGVEGWARALFESIDDAIFVHDLQGRILEANPAACQRLGYTRDEMLRLTTRDIDEPDFAAGFADRLNQQLAHGYFHCEGRHRTKDGRIIPVDINTSAINFQGTPAVLAVMRDITERKQVEEAVQKQKALLESILDNMGDGVLVADERGHFLVVNPAAKRQFGSCLPDLAGQSPSGPCRLFLPDMTTPFPVQDLPLLRCVRGEQVDEVEMFVRAPHAARGLWTSLTGRPLRDKHGQVRGGVLVCHDVTERKRGERRQAVQYAVTRTLAEVANFEEAAPRLLGQICDGFGWDVGALWVLDGGPAMRCVDLWQRPGTHFPEFLAQSRGATYRKGVGLPGHVWAAGRPVWKTSALPDESLPRLAAATREGLRGGFAFPIHRGNDISGVIEFFTRAAEKPDEDVLSLMASLGSQIGHVLERHHLTRQLRESETLYHSLVESLPQNIFRKDREGRVTFGNQRYCTSLKRPLHELLGKTDYDLFPPHLAQKYREDDRRVMETGRTYETVEQHRLPDGDMLYVRVVKSPIRDSQGKVVGTQGMFWDVTARKRAQQALKESERRYRQLTEATLDAIVVADMDRRITLFNAAAERAFGYGPDEIVGQLIDVLVPPRYREQHRNGFVRYLQTRQSRIVGHTIEIEGLRKDGTVFPMEMSLSAIELGGKPDAQGRPALQFLGAIRDLTERNRIRAALVQSEKLASIGLLSAGVAHEINNPLAFVGNNLVVLDRDCKGLMQLLDRYEQLCAGAALPPEQLRAVRELADEVDVGYIRANLARLLARTRDGIDRVTRIVHSLRGLARTDSPDFQDASIPDLVEASLEMIRGRIRRRGIELALEYDGPSRLRCVPTQIGQVLLNLLVNALQAVETSGQVSGGRMWVRTRRLDREFLVEVGDNGCGIDPEHLPRLFDPFFTTKDVGEGTGLGLSISHNIVTGHGGRVEVDSQPGRGSTFRLYFPLPQTLDPG